MTYEENRRQSLDEVIQEYIEDEKCGPDLLVKDLLDTLTTIREYHETQARKCDVVYMKLNGILRGFGTVSEVPTNAPKAP